jgi:hypothetical protein
MADVEPGQPAVILLLHVLLGERQLDAGCGDVLENVFKHGPTRERGVPARLATEEEEWRRSTGLRG